MFDRTHLLHRASSLRASGPSSEDNRQSTLSLGSERPTSARATSALRSISPAAPRISNMIMGGVTARPRVATARLFIGKQCSYGGILSRAPRPLHLTRAPPAGNRSPSQVYLSGRLGNHQVADGAVITAFDSISTPEVTMATATVEQEL